MDFKPEYIERLAKIINDNGLTEISMEDGEQAITIRKDLPEVVVGASTPVVASPAAAPAAQVIASENEAKAEPEAQGKAITSPISLLLSFLLVGDTLPPLAL